MRGAGGATAGLNNKEQKNLLVFIFDLDIKFIKMKEVYTAKYKNDTFLRGDKEYE